MTALRYTLVTDGPSDGALLPILTWLLKINGVTQAVQPEWADLRHVCKPADGIVSRIETALDMYPCDLLFVHRDAERDSPERRRAEIREATEQLSARIDVPPAVCVVPVRMTEAWLLFDESAIRHVASNPRGRVTLNLPLLRRIESLPDPKDELNSLLRTASELSGRRLTRFSTAGAMRRVAERIADFSPLRRLTAFAALEAEVKAVVSRNQWTTMVDP